MSNPANNSGDQYEQQIPQGIDDPFNMAGARGPIILNVSRPRSAISTIFIVLASAAGIGMLLCFGSAFFFAFVIGMIAASGEMAVQNMPERLAERIVSGEPSAHTKVAVIAIEGAILGSNDDFVHRQIRQATDDKHVAAIVLRVDSPGGTITGSDFYLHLLNKLKNERKIPIVVSMGGVAASGGYYVSMASDEIFAEPSTITGSIGVIVSLFDASTLFAKIGVESTPIASGPMKTMGSIAKPMSPEEKKLWEALVAAYFDQFKDRIKKGRANFAADPEKLDKLATGQIYLAGEAIENGLIDKIGFLEDAVDRAMELASVSKNNSRVIRYRPRMSFMNAVLESEIRSVDPLAKAADAFSPKLYYLTPRYLP